MGRGGGGATKFVTVNVGVDWVESLRPLQLELTQLSGVLQRSKLLTISCPEVDFDPAQDNPAWRECEANLLASPLSSHSAPDAVLRSWGRVLASVGSIQDLSKPLEQSRVNVLFVPDDDLPPPPVLVGDESENVDEVREGDPQ